MSDPFQGLDPNLVPSMSKVVKDEIMNRNRLLSRKFKSQSHTMSTILILLATIEAIKQSQSTFQKRSLPTDENVVKFYVDLNLFRLNNLAETAKVILSRTNTRQEKTDHFVGLAKTMISVLLKYMSESPDYIRKTVFIELTGLLDTSLDKFVESCILTAQGVEEMEKLAHTEDLFEAYYRKFSGLTSEQVKLFRGGA